MRNSSALSTTSCLSLFLLPFGRPGFFLSAVFLTFFASALILLATFSSALFTTCTACSGYDRSSRTFTREKAKNERLGMTRCCIPEKKRSSPYVSLPALLTTTSSPATIYSSSGTKKHSRKNNHWMAFHGSTL